MALPEDCRNKIREIVLGHDSCRLVGGLENEGAWQDLLHYCLIGRSESCLLAETSGHVQQVIVDGPGQTTQQLTMAEQVSVG